MGLGKTLTALALVFEYRDEWPVLVICPPMLRHQWRDQILHWLGHVVAPSEVQLLMNGKEQIASDAAFVVVPYSLIAREHLQRKPDSSFFKVVICDESHWIKEHTAQRTQATVPILKKAARVVLLSGTPSLNNAVELHPQLQGILGVDFASFKAFAERYCNKRIVRFGGRRFERWTGVRHEDELGILLRHLMVRRKKEDVLTQLPQKRRQRIVVPASDLSALKDAERLLSSDGGLDLPEYGQDALKEAFKRMCDAKIKSTQDYVSYLLEGFAGKALLFAHHVIMMDAMEQVVRSKKVKFIRIDGKTNQAMRPKLIHTFQQDPEVRVAVLSITACSEGLNLTAASTVVFCELYWVPGVMEQCEARAHRMGQESMVDVHYVVVENSMDEQCFRSLSKKSGHDDRHFGRRGQSLQTGHHDVRPGVRGVRRGSGHRSARDGGGSTRGKGLCGGCQS